MSPTSGGPTTRRRWWRETVVYQIYPRSFLDTDADGVGDLRGIGHRIDHLADLGVGALWLSPIYRSPMTDFGYDVSDHCDVDPLFGDLAEFDRLLGRAHDRGLRVLLDWVPNHTSVEHAWFRESRSSRSSPKRNWYVWRDPAADGGPPNNWVAAFDPDSPAWTYDGRTGQYYLHLFLPEQPDLNWANPEVESAQHDVLRFWLDRGVDGFRADVVHLIGKDPALPDEPPERASQSRVGYHHEPRTHPLLRRIRGVLDAYPGDRAIVGEINLHDSSAIAEYHGEGDELHLAFNFALLRAGWNARRWRTAITEVVEAYEPVGAWPTWVLSNHDEPRHVTRYGSVARARAAAVALLSLPGTPFLYAGEELGLSDAAIPPHLRVDPGGREGCRAPIPWERGPDHGWPAEPWLPWPPSAGALSAEAQRGDPTSTLELYRHLLRVRRSSEALRAGTFAWRDAPPDVLAFDRGAEDDRRAVLVNFAASPRSVAMPGAWEIDASSRRKREGQAFGGAVSAEEGLVLRPSR